VGDPSVLPQYPFRDDSLPLWEATRRLVDAYVRLYYRSDADVLADTELAAWIREIGASDGGRLPKLVAAISLRTVEDVIELVTRVVFRATTYHAAINDSSYDFVSYAPNMPSSVFAPLPPRGTPSADALPAMLPPIGIAWEVLSSTYQVYALHVNKLGQYPSFADDRVAPLIARFQQDLELIEAATADRDAARPVPYRFLLPSRITASINA
jgi:arachidonate 15-lipoxygenase